MTKNITGVRDERHAHAPGKRVLNRHEWPGIERVEIGEREDVEVWNREPWAAFPWSVIKRSVGVRWDYRESRPVPATEEDELSILEDLRS